VVRHGGDADSRHAQNCAIYRVLRTAVIPVVRRSLNGSLVKPHVLNKEEVKARTVKDFETLSLIEELVTEPIDFYAALAPCLRKFLRFTNCNKCLLLDSQDLVICYTVFLSEDTG
jgi:hypothetical protein